MFLSLIVVTHDFVFLTANYRGDMVNCYHQACDNIETMLQDDNLQFLGKTADAIRSTLNTLSETGSGTNFYYIPCINLLLFFSEIVLISSRVMYFTSDDITFSYFTSDDMTFAVTSS